MLHLKYQSIGCFPKEYFEEEKNEKKKIIVYIDGAYTYSRSCGGVDRLRE